MAKILYMVLYQEASFQLFSHLNFYLLVYSLIQTDQKDKVDRLPPELTLGLRRPNNQSVHLKTRPLSMAVNALQEVHVRDQEQVVEPEQGVAGALKQTNSRALRAGDS